MMYLGVFSTSAATVSQSFQYILKKNTHKHAIDICSLTKKKKKEVKKQQLCVLTAVIAHCSSELLKGKRRRNNYTV